MIKILKILFLGKKGIKIIFVKKTKKKRHFD